MHTYVHKQNKFLGWLNKTEKCSLLPAQSSFLRIFENVAKNSHGWPGYRKNVPGITCSVNNVLYKYRKIILLVLHEIVTGTLKVNDKILHRKVLLSKLK